MNVPKLRFKEFNDTYNKEILKNISTITMGQSPNSVNYTNNIEDTILIQGNADLQEGKIFPRIFTTQITKTCDIDDIIMTVRAPVGDLAITQYNACIGRGVCAIKGNKFIYYYLEYLKENKYWNKISKGSTIDSITSDDIKNLVIQIPLNNEQLKISNFLSLLDKKIELQTKKVEDLKLYTQGLIKSLIYNLNCNKKRIFELFTVSAGGDIKKEHISSIKTKTFCYPIYSNNLDKDGLYGYSNIYKIKENSITITGRGEIGVAKVRNGFYYPIVRLIVLIPKKNYNLKYFQEAINNIKIIPESTGIPQLTAPQISNYFVNVPTIDIQNKIGTIIEIKEKKIFLEELKLKKLQELKKGFMQSMFV